MHPWHQFTVAHRVRLVAVGWDLAQIQEGFPLIDAEDARHALLYAAKVEGIADLFAA